MSEINREKVIKGLYAHGYRDCKSCPYWGSGENGKSICTQLARDAFAMLKELEEQIKNRDESLEKAREEIKWLRGMLKEQEVVKPRIDAFGLPYCPKCKTLVYNTWEFCPHCGQELKWDD